MATQPASLAPAETEPPGEGRKVPGPASRLLQRATIAFRWSQHRAAESWRSSRSSVWLPGAMRASVAGTPGTRPVQRRAATNGQKGRNARPLAAGAALQRARGHVTRAARARGRAAVGLGWAVRRAARCGRARLDRVGVGGSGGRGAGAWGIRSEPRRSREAMAVYF